jgi:hypothetical protein
MAKGPQFQLSVPTGGESLRGIGVMLAAYFITIVSEAMVKWVLPEVGPAVAMIFRGVVGGMTVAILARGCFFGSAFCVALPPAWCFTFGRAACR